MIKVNDKIKKACDHALEVFNFTNISTNLRHPDIDSTKSCLDKKKSSDAPFYQVMFYRLKGNNILKPTFRKL